MSCVLHAPLVACEAEPRGDAAGQIERCREVQRGGDDRRRQVVVVHGERAGDIHDLHGARAAALDTGGGVKMPSDADSFTLLPAVPMVCTLT